jgi:hypothetical protein
MVIVRNAKQVFTIISTSDIKRRQGKLGIAIGHCTPPDCGNFAVFMRFYQFISLRCSSIIHKHANAFNVNTYLVPFATSSYYAFYLNLST